MEFELWKTFKSLISIKLAKPAVRAEPEAAQKRAARHLQAGPSLIGHHRYRICRSTALAFHRSIVHFESSLFPVSLQKEKRACAAASSQ